MCSVFMQYRGHLFSDRPLSVLVLLKTETVNMDSCLGTVSKYFLFITNFLIFVSLFYQ